jgi:hypothetical protein
MPLKLDRDVDAVLEFMERNIEARKLVRVARAVVGLAPFLWGDYQPLQQEKLVMLMPGSRHEQLSVATESRLGQAYVHGDSVVEGDIPSPM